MTIWGEERHWNTLIIPIIESEPPRQRIIGISREVTELQRAREEVEALNCELEQRVAQRTAELKESNRKLHDLAFHDPLTGLGNRRYFEIQSAKLIALAQRKGGESNLVMLDIDHFKRINDNYGHPFGDLVLQGLATLLQTLMRSSDVLCRYGGEEFLILLPFTDNEEATEFARRLQQAVREIVFDAGGKTVRISASFGVASMGKATENLSQLVANVDQALYRAKRNGRDRIECF